MCRPLKRRPVLFPGSLLKGISYTRSVYIVAIYISTQLDARGNNAMEISLNVSSSFCRYVYTSDADGRCHLYETDNHISIVLLYY